MKKIAITLLTACVGGAVALGTYKLMESKYAGGLSLEDKQKVYFTNNPLNVSSSTGQLDFTQAAAAVTPGVVHIKTTYKGQQRGGNDPFDDMFNDFFGGRQRQATPVMASGSGVIISDDGYIVTNNHVVENATDINVILTDKRSLKAKVIGRDPNTDLALIKVSATKLPVVKLGNSDNVRVGEWVLAVGYPFTLQTTVTAGIVSAKGRSIGILGQGDDDDNPYQRRGQPQAKINKAIESFIQTDAAINRGNSGGALVNTNGELIGINAAIASQSGNYEGYGFAIPINLAKKILDDFMKFGTVKRGYIGVSFQELDADVAKSLGTTQINGLFVSEVIPGGGAESAGLKKGDVIVKVDDSNIYSSADLQERVARLRPGDKIKIAYLRDGKEHDANITLKGEESVKVASNESGQSSEELYNRLGASFAPLSASQKQHYHLNSGVVVSEVRSGGIFDQQEVSKGTIITSVNGKPINKTDDIDAALSSGKSNMIQLSGITPDGAQFRYSFPVAG